MDVEQRARELLAALVKIRDSTFRDAAALRGIADMAINSDRAGDFNAVALTPPDGFVLVPINPTRDMVVAGVESESECKFPSEIYAAMLAARPEVKS